MAGFPNYRYISDPQELMSILKNRSELNKAMVWQTLGSRRDIYHIDRIDVIDGRVLLQTTGEFDFMYFSPVYFYIDHRNLIFKLNDTDIKVHKNILVLNLPKVAKCLEDRIHPRFQFPLDSLKVSLKSLSGQVTDYATGSFCDISKFGFSIYWPSKQKDFFKKFHYFKMVKINSKETNIPADFSVAHVSPTSDSRLVKVGFSSDSVFLENFQAQLFGSL
jgi:hypothetical protein